MGRVLRVLKWLGVALAIVVVAPPVIAFAFWCYYRVTFVPTPAPEPPPVAQFDAAHWVQFPSLATPRFPVWGIAPQAEGYLFRPAGPGPFPAAVMLHGCSGFQGLAGYRRWVDRLVSWGYAVLVVDGNGWRGALLCVEFWRIDPESYAGDAYGGLRYLATLPGIAADRAALLGWSFGGLTLFTALRSATGLHGEPAVLQAFPQMGPQRFKAAVAFYPAAFSQTMRVSVPLLMLVGEKDGMGNAGRLEELAENARKAGDPVSVKVYPGAYHGFDAETAWERGLLPFQYDPAATADAAGQVRVFLDANLKGK